MKTLKTLKSISQKYKFKNQVLQKRLLDSTDAKRDSRIFGDKLLPLPMQYMSLKKSLAQWPDKSASYRYKEAGEARSTSPGALEEYQSQS